MDQAFTAAWRHWDDMKRAGTWVKDRVGDVGHDAERAGGWAKHCASDAWHAVSHVFGSG
jgi:hypothetical protein